MKDIKITSKDLLKMNSFELPQRATEFSKYSFWYYTSLNTADLILLNKSIYISNIKQMNDVDETNIHQSDNELVHCLCMCNSNTEKIPMWYLYSGITGKGASIGFTPSVLIQLIKSIKTVTTVDGKKVLNKGADFDIEYGWIYYRKGDQKSQVMYKRKWYSISDPETFEDKNYFLKSYPWEYEKEFRIVIKNKTKEKYDKLVIDVSSVYSKLKVKLAPEISPEGFLELLPSLSGFNAFFTQKVLHSDLKVNMDLCKRNFECFLEYIETDMKTKHEIDASKICAVIKPVCGITRSSNNVNI